MKFNICYLNIIYLFTMCYYQIWFQIYEILFMRYASHILIYVNKGINLTLLYSNKRGELLRGNDIFD